MSLARMAEGPRVAAVLARLGYEVRFRPGVWVDCLVSRADEGWLGAGRTEEEALRVAIDRAFPSHGARHLLEAAAAREQPFDATDVAPPRSEVRLSRVEDPPDPVEAAAAGGVPVEQESASRVERVDRVDAALQVAPTAAASEGDLVAWLVGLLAVTDGLEPEVRKVLLPLAERIAVLPATLPGANRRAHRRLKRLKDALRQARGGQAPVARSAAGDESVVSVRICGARVAFLGNRSDETLRSALLRAFLFGELDMVESGRHADHLIARIASGSYDLVLAATGFLDHSVFEKVSRECKRTGIPCLAVDRGRVGAVRRALAALGYGATG